MTEENKSVDKMSYKELFERMTELTTDYVEQSTGWDKIPKVFTNIYREEMLCLTNEFSRRLDNLEKIARRSNCLDSD